MIPSKEMPLCRGCLTDHHEEHESDRLRSATEPGKYEYCLCPICAKRNPTDPKPQEALAAPLEPRCPKCGSSNLHSLGVELAAKQIAVPEILCKSCRYDLFPKKLADFAQFFCAQPPSAMTEPGGERPTPVHMPPSEVLAGPHKRKEFAPAESVHGGNDQAGKAESEPLQPASTCAAAEPHTLTREDLLKKVRQAYQTYQHDTDDKRSLANFIVDFALSLSLPSPRPSGEELNGFAWKWFEEQMPGGIFTERLTRAQIVDYLTRFASAAFDNGTKASSLEESARDYSQR